MRARGEQLGEAALAFVALTVVGVLAGTVLWLVGDGVRHVATFQRAVDLITSVPRELESGGGVGPQLFNTVYLALLSTLVLAPLGIGTAAYLGRFSDDRGWVRLARLALDSLATLPTMVYGLFGFLALVVTLRLGYSLLGGALVLAVVNLPLVVSVSEQAIRAVPREIEQAALALGASRVQTLLRITLPHAWPAIVSSLVLAVGRVFAETAPLIYTAGLSTDPRTPYSPSPMRAGETLAVHLWYLNSNGVVPDKRLISAGAATLLILLAVGTHVLGRRIARLSTLEATP